MAFIAIALFAGVFIHAAPAPQVVTRLHAVPSDLAGVRAIPATLQTVRTVPAAAHELVQEVRALPAAVSTRHSSITHATPSHSVVRTVASAAPVVHAAPVRTASVVRTVAQAGPAVVRTTPVVHEVHEPAVSVVRTAPVVHEVHEPAVSVVRTAAVAQPAAVVRHVPVVDQVVATRAHAHYNYGYSVNDGLSGDLKARQESRDGDVVTGSYTVQDPDGRIRHVEYTADRDHGFQAHVTYDGAPGPVSLGLNSPRATHVAHVAAAPTTVVSDGGVIAARGGALPATVVRTGTLPVAPATVVRTQPAVIPAATVVRSEPAIVSGAATVVRSQPAVVPAATVVRSDPLLTSNVIRTAPIQTLGTNGAALLGGGAGVQRTAGVGLGPVVDGGGAGVLRTAGVGLGPVVDGGGVVGVSPVGRAQLIGDIPVGTQIFQDGQVVRSTVVHN